MPLHVFTGDAAAMTVAAALRIPDNQILIQHDVISCGPVPAFASREEWFRTRNDLWLEVCGGPTLQEFPKDLVTDAARIAEADCVTIWVGAGLSDRLLLPAIVRLAELGGLDLPPIDLVAATNHRSLKSPMLGWGMLRAEDVGHPTITRATADDLTRARRTWAGLTAPTPTEWLDSLDGVDDDRDLVAALSTLIGRYPDVRSGLSHWDAALMAATSNTGSDAFAVIGGAIGANSHWLDPVGDMYLFWRLKRLAGTRLKRPLVLLEGNTSNARGCRVMPTDFGIAVRDGEANHAGMNGVDDWIGGVHLQSSRGSPWVRQKGGLVKTV
jgi:hypothetical protein